MATTMRTPELAPPVVIVRWPSEAPLRAHVQRLGRARLLLIEHGAEVPPIVDRFEDWVLEGTNAYEVDLRVAALGRRFADRPSERPVLEDGDLLRFDGGWVALSPTETKVARLLLAHFDHCVTRDEIAAAVGASEGSSSINSLVKRLRSRITPLGLTLNNVHGRGYVLSNRSFDRPRPPRR